MGDYSGDMREIRGGYEDRVSLGSGGVCAVGWGIAERFVLVVCRWGCCFSPVRRIGKTMVSFMSVSFFNVVSSTENFFILKRGVNSSILEVVRVVRF